MFCRRVVIAGAIGTAGLVVAVGVPATAGAKQPTPKPPTGIACLKGRWISTGLTSRPPGVSGLAGVVLRITEDYFKGEAYGGMDANYDTSSPELVLGVPGYYVVRGSIFGKFIYDGHGRYAFTAQLSSEQVTVYEADGHKLKGPIDVKQGGSAWAHLTCSATKLTTVSAIPTAKGNVLAKATFRRQG